ncbi:hypothetical protein [Mycolicibacterium litorale]|nr:hypothetical protein [Mycolicibacterium litorale]
MATPLWPDQLLLTTAMTAQRKFISIITMSPKNTSRRRSEFTSAPP